MNILQYLAPEGNVYGCYHLSVCWFFCVCNNFKSNESILLNFFMWEGPEQCNKSLNFGKDPNHILDTKIILVVITPKSNERVFMKFLYG